MVKRQQGAAICLRHGNPPQLVMAEVVLLCRLSNTESAAETIGPAERS